MLITSVEGPRDIKYTDLRPAAKLRKPTKNSHAVAVLNFAVTFCTMATTVWNWRPPNRKVWWNHGHSHLFLPKQKWTAYVRHILYTHVWGVYSANHSLVTSVLILRRQEGKALKTWDDFVCFTFGYPSLLMANTHKIIPINVCMLNTSHCDSVYTPNGSFIWITSVERTKSSIVQSPPPPYPPRCQQYERITGQVRFSSNYT